jgi:alpha-L-fucosidase 2
VARFAASQPGTLRGAFKLWRKLDSSSRFARPHFLELSGQAGTQGTRFFALAQVLAQGEKARIEGTGQWLRVEDANEIVLLISCATDFRHPNFEEQARKYLDEATTRSYEELKQRHVEDHQKLFRRASFSLGQSDSQVLAGSTRERLEEVKAGGSDLGLVSLYWSFARYLLLGSGRAGCLPPNLQA